MPNRVLTSERRGRRHTPTQVGCANARSMRTVTTAPDLGGHVRTARTATIAMVAVVGLVAASCGGDDDSDSGGATTGVGSAAPATTSEATEAEATTTEAEATTTEAAPDTTSETTEAAPSSSAAAGEFTADEIAQIDAAAMASLTNGTTGTIVSIVDPERGTFLKAYGTADDGGHPADSRHALPDRQREQDVHRRSCVAPGRSGARGAHRPHLHVCRRHPERRRGHRPGPAGHAQRPVRLRQRPGLLQSVRRRPDDALVDGGHAGDHPGERRRSRRRTRRRCTTTATTSSSER